jgi:hypothetical protein
MNEHRRPWFEARMRLKACRGCFSRAAFGRKPKAHRRAAGETRTPKRLRERDMLDR